MRTKDLVLSALFASSWVASQYYLGPVVGSFSLGPISFHGSVNRIVGWLCMTVLSSLTNAFGPVSLMSAIAAVATRPLRAQQLEGLSVGLGYFLGGLSYETLILRSRGRARWHLVVALVSGLIANTPYTLLKLYFLGPEGFLIFAPLYSISVIRTTLFSMLGTSAGLMVLKSYQLFSKSERSPWCV